MKSIADGFCDLTKERMFRQKKIPKALLKIETRRFTVPLQVQTSKVSTVHLTICVTVLKAPLLRRPAWTPPLPLLSEVRAFLPSSPA